MLEQETPNIASMASLPTLSAPGLLVMDVDSTLIDEEVIDELGVAAGVGEQIASVTARAMNGELDFREALRARFDYEEARRQWAPMKFACPSMVLRDGKTNSGTTEPFTPWGDTVAER